MDSLIAPHSLSVFELLVRVTILLSAALALAWLARNRSARVRHLLWTLTFALLLALPGLSLFGPSWEVPIIPSIGSASPAAPPGGSPGRWCRKRVHHTPRTRPGGVGCRIHAGPGAGVGAADALHPPSTSALGSGLRRRTGLAGDGRGSVRRPWSRGNSA